LSFRQLADLEVLFAEILGASRAEIKVEILAAVGAEIKKEQKISLLLLAFCPSPEAPGHS